MELVTLQLDQIKPYENNPRYNAEAVFAVTESINQVGYITPIVVDENYCILAGHTRLSSLKYAGYDEAEVIIVRGLTDEQKRKFRLLDNKTAEIATWDLDKLKTELDNLSFGNFDFWDKELARINAKQPEVTKEKKSKEDKIIRCPKCGRIVMGGMVELGADWSNPIGGDWS